MTEIKTAFDGLISRLDTAEERICELEDRARDTSQTDVNRKKNEKNRTEHSRIVRQFQRIQLCHNWNTRRRKEREWNRRILQIIMAKTFPKLMKTTNHRSKKLREHQAGKY